MKTSIVKLSTNETLCVNGGIGTGLSNNAEIHKSNIAMLAHKYLKPVAIGGSIFVTSLTAKIAHIAHTQRKKGAVIGILKKISV